MSNDSRFVHLETHKYGLGVFTLTDIKKGEFIASFDGLYYWADNAMALENTLPFFAGRHAIQYMDNGWRDGSIDGTARYISHSCKPNCGIRSLFNIEAMHDIKAGEELRWDYAMSEDSNFRMECLCDSLNCRKEVGAFSMLSAEQREDFVNRYSGFISNWLVRKYRLY